MARYHRIMVEDPNEADPRPPASEGQGATVQAGMWVTLHYRIFDSGGEPVEEAPRELRYLHGGFGAIFPKLENALEGLAAGSSARVTLQPEDAFGDYDAERLTLMAAHRLPEGSEVGMTFDGLPGEAPDGTLYTLTDLAEGQAVLDGNHPLAGLSLRYELTVRKLEQASAQDIEQEQREAGI